jgi:hypothetical protein
VGSTATVFLPAKNSAEIAESGQSIEHQSEIQFQRMDGGKAVFTIPSGEYNFTSTIQ